MVFKKHSIGNVFKHFALAEYGVPISKVTELKTVSRRTIFELKKKARE